ncbi:hypothetical protein Tco_0927654 [Tanacetum coccineum]
MISIYTTSTRVWASQLCLFCERIEKLHLSHWISCVLLLNFISAIELSLSLKKLRIAKGKKGWFGEDNLLAGKWVRVRVYQFDFGEEGKVPQVISFLIQLLGVDLTLSGLTLTLTV